jgi:hypothetical protein
MMMIKLTTIIINNKNNKFTVSHNLDTKDACNAEMCRLIYTPELTEFSEKKKQAIYMQSINSQSKMKRKFPHEH